MNRLPPADEKKDPELAAVFAELRASRGWISNALRSLGHAPDALRRFALIGDYVRYHTRLPDRMREIVIITTGRGIPYAVGHHAPLALQNGITKEELDSLLSGKVPGTFGETDAAAVRFVLEFTSGKPVTDGTFEALRAVMSPRQITDVIMTSAYFVALAMMITTLGVELETEEKLRGEQDWQRKKNQGQ